MLIAVRFDTVIAVNSIDIGKLSLTFYGIVSQSWENSVCSEGTDACTIDWHERMALQNLATCHGSMISCCTLMIVLEQ